MKYTAARVRVAPVPVVLALVLAGTLVAGGCSSEEAATPNAPGDARRHVAQLDDHLSLGEAVTAGNLTVWPVFTDQPLDLGRFLTLSEALERGVAEVREVGAASGQVLEIREEGEPGVEIELDRPADGAPATEPPIRSDPDPTESVPAESGESIQVDGRILESNAQVNTLVIENKGEHPILICAGTVVHGGNQDRQIGQDFVVQAGRTVPVDAFCVEAGRWNDERMGTSTDGQFLAGSSFALIGVRSKGQYETDQEQVWEEVAKVKDAIVEDAKRVLSERHLAAVMTNSSLAVAMDANDEANGRRIDALAGRIRAHFASFGGANAPVGFAYAIQGKPVNVRCFAHARVFEQQFETFLRTMATESILAGADRGERAEARDVVAMVREIEKATEERRDTSALNWNGVRRGVAGFAANCYVPGALAGGGASKSQLIVTRDWTARVQ